MVGEENPSCNTSKGEIQVLKKRLDSFELDEEGFDLGEPESDITAAAVASKEGHAGHIL